MPLASWVRRALRGGDAPRDEPGVPLEAVRRRLELFLAAMYGQGISIAAAEPGAPPPLLRRLLGRTPHHLRDAAPAASLDGDRILLPPRLAEGDAFARYQLFAVEQAERLVRGTPLLAPGDDAPLERDLYLLAESASVDASIARAAPGLVPALRSARAAALARRPLADALTPPERAMEALVRGLLTADPTAPPAELASADPAESLDWARAAAAEARFAGGGYRGLSPVEAWGKVLPVKTASAAAPARQPDWMRHRPVMGGSNIGPKRAGTGVGKDAGQTADVPWAPKTSKASAGQGEASAAGSGADPDPDADTPAAGGDAETQPTSEAAPPKGARVRPERRDAFEYPEWDWKTERYVERASTVRIAEPLVADGAWAAEVLRGHAAVVRRLREKFERLRARRVRLTRQREGDELDLAACVGALVDRRAGQAPDDRLYLQVRPARRGLAIAILVDISGSTDERVGASRIIDLEKVALLLTCEALEALGDEYTVLTFSGKGADHVRLRTIKAFGERMGEAVRRRITALRPEGYTRLGPAVRHASALLARPGSGHRLLLILSDGRPNDVDEYNGRYGIEDSRQAVAEARQQGIFPFCLTVDRKGPAYISRIFGPSGHVILRHADQLPLALSQAVRNLLGG